MTNSKPTITGSTIQVSPHRDRGPSTASGGPKRSCQVRPEAATVRNDLARSRSEAATVRNDPARVRSEAATVGNDPARLSDRRAATVRNDPAGVQIGGCHGQKRSCQGPIGGCRGPDRRLPRSRNDPARVRSEAATVRKRSCQGPIGGCHAPETILPGSDRRQPRSQTILPGSDRRLPRSETILPGFDRRLPGFDPEAGRSEKDPGGIRSAPWQDVKNPRRMRSGAGSLERLLEGCDPGSGEDGSFPSLERAAVPSGQRFAPDVPRTAADQALRLACCPAARARRARSPTLSPASAASRHHPGSDRARSQLRKPAPVA